MIGAGYAGGGCRVDLQSLLNINADLLLVGVPQVMGMCISFRNSPETTQLSRDPRPERSVPLVGSAIRDRDLRLASAFGGAGSFRSKSLKGKMSIVLSR